MKLNKRVNDCATTLKDGRLLKILSGGDVVAQELKYHPACLTSLYNRERAYLRNVEQREQSQKQDVYPLAFSELVTYIVETKLSFEGPTIFKLADMVNLYKQRLQQLGMETPDVNCTRLKDKLLAELPELEAHKKGRDVLLAFRKDVGFSLSQASNYTDAMTLAKAATILRRHMLDHKFSFEGTFHEGIENAIPPSLLQFVGMIEHGADIKSQLRFGASKSDLAIAQLLQYNCYTRYKEGASTHRHSKDRETPFPIYMGMSIYAKTRKKLLVNMLHDHGLGISYDRVLEISAQLGDASINRYIEDGVVCPHALRRGLFTITAMDNIDHNPTATTATTSFHGTSISAFQLPTEGNQGEFREPLTLRLGEEKVKKVPELPEFYTNIRPAFFTKKNPSPPRSHGVQTVQDNTLLGPQLALEYAWLEKVSVEEETDGAVNLTWSAHHASQKRSPKVEVSVTSLLPLFRDPAHSVATIRHVMDKVMETVTFLNPGQIPVMTADQPIYALAKQIQWHWPEQYGEDKFIMMFGGLHIELAALRSVGTILQGSGWTWALVEAGVASSGTAESFLSAASITRTRQAHQITACSLYQLMKAAYSDYCTEAADNSEELLSFDAWCDSRKLQSPQFQFWSLVLSMELVILLLIRAFREANFNLYCQALAELIPYFFANNNTKYARWLPIHLKDMLTLKEKHPQLAEEFESGKFVVHKSRRDFSGMAIDQAHEQANAVIKADGGAVGVTEDPSALRRWMIAGPQVSHLVEQYEAASEAKEAVEPTSHHNQTSQAQRVFMENVKKLTQVLKELSNPFQEETRDLLSLDTKDIAHPSVVELLSTHYERGRTSFQQFMEGLQNREVTTFYDPIKKNMVDFFRQEPASTDASKRKVLKEDCQLFSKLFISCQSRECDLQEFFRHENQQFPASLSEGGKLYTSQKSQLAAILESKVTIPDVEPQADTIIIDGSALVNTLLPRTSKTFEDYAILDVLPIVQAYSTKYKRTDIVFDVYKPSSLKGETRLKRGHGAKRRVTNRGRIPSNWRNFLRESDNKTELFRFLADKITQMSTPNLVIVTRDEDAASNRTISLEGIAPCSQEEADTRIFVHARHAVQEGSKVLMVKASDTDILVIALSVLPLIQQFGLLQLWVAFGQGYNLRWFPIHDLYFSIGMEKSKGILFFHAFTGCDVVSGFRGKGKKSAWQTWNKQPAIKQRVTAPPQFFQMC
uniref:Uncharacterized protein n=1 Tax=Branchiostoma floridae TaxID=7739 RepID=C3YAF8_BRAFL|eukprot:XP_002606696.1 hypothetical protein BRAFLDRAFT_72537 [Branchiostoma floridae]